MRAFLRAVRMLLVAVVAAGSLSLAGAAPAAAAVPYCVLGLVYQDAFVPGSRDLDPDCIMAQGAQGNHVSTLQQAMKSCNLKESIAVDGIFGPQTRSALIRLQRNRGITADGVYGPQTRRAIQFVKVGGGCKRTK